MYACFFEFLPTPCFFLLVLYHCARPFVKTVLSNFFPGFCQRYDKQGSLHTRPRTQN